MKCSICDSTTNKHEKFCLYFDVNRSKGITGDEPVEVKPTRTDGSNFAFMAQHSYLRPAPIKVAEQSFKVLKNRTVSPDDQWLVRADG